MRGFVRTGASFTIGCLLALGLFCIAKPLRAADEAPTAWVLLAGSDELLTDGKFILSLTDANEQKQWPVLKDYLDVFLIGVDPSLPTRIQVIFGDKETRQVWSVPVNKLGMFLKENLPTLTTRVRLIGEGLYRLGNGKKEDFNGFLLYSKPYTHIGITQEDVKLVPADPQPSMQALLAKKYILGLDVKNQRTDAPAQAKRREMFQGTRKDAIAALKKDKGESAADFELRKKALDLQMDEVEWFFAESQHLVWGLGLDKNKKLAHADLQLTPIADSPLGKAISLLQTKPSYFASVPKSPDPILSARLNHPLTEARQKNFLALAALVRDDLNGRVDGNEKLKPDEKEATKQVLGKTHALFEAAVKAGVADGFVDVRKGSADKDVLVAAFRSPDGTKVDEIVNLLPKTGTGIKIKLNAAEESGVKIHSVEIPKGQHKVWDDLIGSEVAYIGSSKEAVWCAAGQGALEALKAAIQKLKQPLAADAAKAPWAELIMRLKPWVQQAATELPKRKGEGEYRKLVVSAMEPGDDQLTIRMTRDGEKIVGELEAQAGLLRFAGKFAAYFSKENLDTQKKGGGGGK